MQLKTENDWKMCYLARTQGSDKSFIEWGFDLDGLHAESGKKLDKIEIRCENVCYENGEIKWNLSNLVGVENSISMEKESVAHNSLFRVEWANDRFKVQMSTAKSFRLRADLSKGSGINAWQHTQLFRQSLNDTDKYLFEISFYFI